MSFLPFRDFADFSFFETHTQEKMLWRLYTAAGRWSGQLKTAHTASPTELIYNTRKSCSRLAMLVLVPFTICVVCYEQMLKLFTFPQFDYQ